MLSNIFKTRSISCNLRSQTDFIRSNTSTSQYGLNSIRCFASKVWQMIPLELKKSVSIESLKEKSESGSQLVVTVSSVSRTYTISDTST